MAAGELRHATCTPSRAQSMRNRRSNAHLPDVSTMMRSYFCSLNIATPSCGETAATYNHESVRQCLAAKRCCSTTTTRRCAGPRLGLQGRGGSAGGCSTRLGNFHRVHLCVATIEGHLDLDRVLGRHAGRKGCHKNLVARPLTSLCSGVEVTLRSWNRSYDSILAKSLTENPENSATRRDESRGPPGTRTPGDVDADANAGMQRDMAVGWGVGGTCFS